MTDHLADARRWLSTAQDSRSFDRLMSAMDQIIAHLEAQKAPQQPATAPPAAQQGDSGHRDGYTPTTDEVEHRYAYDELYSMDCEADHHAFRRWLAAHDAEVRAQALREAASAPIPRAALNTRNGLRQWLRARADRIERGE